MYISGAVQQDVVAFSQGGVDEVEERLREAHGVLPCVDVIAMVCNFEAEVLEEYIETLCFIYAARGKNLGSLLYMWSCSNG